MPQLRRTGLFTVVRFCAANASPTATNLGQITSATRIRTITIAEKLEMVVEESCS